MFEVARRANISNLKWMRWSYFILSYHISCMSINHMLAKSFSFVQRQRKQKKYFRDIAVCHVSRVWEWRNAFVTLLVAGGCPLNCLYKESDMSIPLARSYYLEIDWRGHDLVLALLQVRRQAGRSLTVGTWEQQASTDDTQCGTVELTLHLYREL